MSTRKIKVLLVDDDVLLGSAVVDELNKRGYDATYLSATYGVEEAIKQIVPDVLVFDVEIGKENGIEMAKTLFNGNPYLPIIFISSHHDDTRKTAGQTIFSKITFGSHRSLYPDEKTNTRNTRAYRFYWQGFT